MITPKNFIPRLKLHTYYVFQSERFGCIIIVMYCCDGALGQHVLLILLVNSENKLKCQHTIKTLTSSHYLLIYICLQ